MKQITGQYNAHGYIIYLEQCHEVIDRYIAGNCRYDSTQTLPINAPGALDIATIEEYAKQTGREMAEEHNAQFLGIEQIDDYEF